MRDGCAQLISQAGTTDAARARSSRSTSAGLPSLLFTPPACDDGLLVLVPRRRLGHRQPRARRSTRSTGSRSRRGAARSASGTASHPSTRSPTPQLDAIAAATLVHRARRRARDRPAPRRRRRRLGGRQPRRGGRPARGPASAPRCSSTRAATCARSTRAAYPHTEGYLLDGRRIDFFLRAAVGDADLARPAAQPELASPVLARGRPAALVITAEYDPLRDDGLEYAATLRAAGVAVERAPLRRPDARVLLACPRRSRTRAPRSARPAAFLTEQFDDGQRVHRPKHVAS